MNKNQEPRISAQNQFGRLAESYKNSKTHTQSNALNSASTYLNNRTYRIAIDIGAGPGFTAFDIASQCESVIATDITPEMLEQVRYLRKEKGAPRTEMMLVQAEFLPYADESIDLITCRTASHHFVDMAQWMNEVSRVLAPKGELIVIDTISPENQRAAEWMHEIEIWRDPSHVKNFSLQEWRDLTNQAKLTIEIETLSKVLLEYPDWTQRAGMDLDEEVKIGLALEHAPNEARKAFGIEGTQAKGINFYWPILNLRATKN
ncbi:MAG: class I SAM-dependent methyltransferase [SAR202 cluster bacterium]|nr:class I SAM-dependent methyltransferase [SAR202 cluster bacterium]|tara:strand:+ start:6084 stop:6866 length:783 start_codon:yes stop_codon:yes gene_type:complete